MSKWTKVRDAAETAASIGGNYLLPGSSLVTSKIVSKGAQDNLNSTLGKVANIAAGATGAGFGSGTTGIPSASDAGYGWTNAGNSLGGAFGSPTLGTDIASGISGITDGISSGLSSITGGITDSLGLGGASSADTNFMNSARTAAGLSPSSSGGLFSGLTGGSSGGGSSYGGLGLAANLIGGYNQDEALKKQKEQLLGANNQQLANLETFDPSNITNDAGYQFNLEQGQKGLNQQLAAGGGLFSGQALKAASEYNQNYANNALKDAYARWANKTGAQNAIYGSGGQIKANTTGGQANNISQTMASALGTNVNGYGTSQDELLKKLLLKQA